MNNFDQYEAAMTDFDKYATTLFRKITTLATDAINKATEDNIHDLRVEIKKLQALFQLLAFSFPELDKKEMDGIAKVFKDTGAIREWDIFLNEAGKQVADEDTLKAVSKLVKEKQKKASARFRKKFEKSGFTVLNELRHLFKKYTEPASGLDHDAYFRNAFSKIEKQWKQLLSEKALHNLRRETKVLKYNLKIASEKTVASFKLFTDSNFFNECEQLLGDWHDASVITTQLKKMTLDDNLSEDLLIQLTGFMELEASAVKEKLANFRQYISQTGDRVHLL